MDQMNPLVLSTRRTEGGNPGLARLESARPSPSPQPCLSPPSPTIRDVVALARVTVFDVWNIDLQEQTFLADVIIKLQCPGLDDKLRAAGWDTDKYGLPQEWQLHNHLHFQNLTDSITPPEGWLTEGTQVFNYRAVGKFSNPTTLEDFPFDTFHIPIEITMLRQLDHVEFELDSTQNLTRQDASVRADYAISEITVSTVGNTRSSESASRLRYPVLVVRMPARRKPTYALLNGVLPTLVITGLAALAAVLPVTQLDQRLGLIFSLVVAMVDFKQSLEFGLPKSAYNTNLDWLILVQNVGIAVAAGFSAAGYLRACRPGSTMEAITWLVSAAPLCALVQTTHGLWETAAGIVVGADSIPVLSWLPSCSAMGLGRPGGDANSTLGALGAGLVGRVRWVADSLPFSRSGGAREWSASLAEMTSISIDGMACPNEAQATRSDHTLWMVWAVCLLIAFASILALGCAARAWAAMAPEWAFRTLFDTEEKRFMQLLKTAGQVRRFEASREAGDAVSVAQEPAAAPELAQHGSRSSSWTAATGDSLHRLDSQDSLVSDAEAGIDSASAQERRHRLARSLGERAWRQPPMLRSSSSTDTDSLSRKDSSGTAFHAEDEPNALNQQNREDYQSVRFLQSLNASQSDGDHAVPSTPRVSTSRRTDVQWTSHRRTEGDWRRLLLRQRQSDRSGKVCCPVGIKCSPCESCCTNIRDPESFIRFAVRCLNAFRFRNAKRFRMADLMRIQDAVTRHSQLLQAPRDVSEAAVTAAHATGTSLHADLPDTFATTTRQRYAVNILRAVRYACFDAVGLLWRGLWAGMQWLGCPMRRIPQHDQVVWVLGVPLRPPRTGEILDKRLDDILWLLFRRGDERTEKIQATASRHADGVVNEGSASARIDHERAEQIDLEARGIGKRGVDYHEAEPKAQEEEDVEKVATEEEEDEEEDDEEEEEEAAVPARRSLRRTRASSGRRSSRRRL